MKATFHISKIMKDQEGNIRKIGSTEWIMTSQLAKEMIQKNIGEFFVKGENALEEIRILPTATGTKFSSYLNNKKTDTFEKLSTYR